MFLMISFNFVNLFSDKYLVFFMISNKFVNLFGDKSVVVLVHALEELFNVRFLPHELGERELLVKISIHSAEEILNLFPGDENLVIHFSGL